MKLGWHLSTDMAHVGYGYVGGMLREHLRRQDDIEILGVDQFGWDAMVAITPPRAMLIGPYEKRRDVVFHTMFEAEPVPPTWIEIANRAGLLWSPSQYCADLFRDAGLTFPFGVSGYGYDPLMFGPISRKGRETPLKVLIWGDNFASRKHLLMAVQAYVWADLKDATLEVKINDSLFRGGITASEDGNPRDDITIISTPLSRNDLVAWLHSGDVLLYPTGGEGYGLIPLEAMVTALCVIGTRNTGMLEYMREDCMLVVPSKGRMLAKTMIANYHIPNMTIEHPDLEAMIAHLRWVADHRDEADAIGQKAYQAVRDLTWQAAGEKAAAILREFVASNQGLLHQTSVVY